MLNPFELRTAKTLWNFGHSECNRVRVHNIKYINIDSVIVVLVIKNCDHFTENCLKKNFNILEKF